MDEQRLAAVLAEFAQTLVRRFSIQDILDHFVEQVAEVLHVTGAGVVLIGPDRELHFVATTDSRIRTIQNLQIELGEGPCLTAYRTGQRVLLPDLANDERFPRFGPRAADAGLRAVYSFPLTADRDRLGALDLYRDHPERLDETELRAAQVLADVASAYVANAQARSEADATVAQMRQRALHDQLTGLPNRTLLEHRLVDALRRAEVYGGGVGVLFVDLDRFTWVNGRYGHLVADEVLCTVASRLSNCLGEQDTLARFIGDQFVVLCDDLASEQAARELADRIHAVLRRPVVVNGETVSITASIGISMAGDVDGATAVLRDANAAMIRAKVSGGNATAVVTMTKREAGRVGLLIENDLAGALDRDELRLVYQPIVGVRAGRLVGAEGLLRWRHPQFGELSPHAIIAAAERSKQVSRLGSWVVDRACRDLLTWRSAGFRLPNVAVNVAPVELADEAYVDRLTAVLDRHGVDPSLICLEVTETSLMTDVQAAQLALARASELGVRVALDDFGTGYSSLTHLQRFPVDTVKVDRSFVTDIAADATNRDIVSGVTQLAHALDLQVTAEGVETSASLEALRDIGCDNAQGYHLSPPQEAAALSMHSA